MIENGDKIVESIQNTFGELVPLLGLKHKNLKRASDKISNYSDIEPDNNKNLNPELEKLDFCHLHTFSQFSILQLSLIHI